jgi:hypothetical protein
MVDALLATYSSMVGDDFIGYRNHVCRVVSLCLAISGDGPDYEEKVTVAAVFHDLGIWTNHTFDYIAPSVALARDYLAACSRANWIPEIEAMIVNHHKISPSHSDPRWLVEPFRRADWIDVSCGLRRFSLPRPFIASLYTTWPTAGFHLRLAELALNRFRRHPLTPLPMVRL